MNIDVVIGWADCETKSSKIWLFWQREAEGDKAFG